MTNATIELPRARRLKAITHDVHEGVDRSVMEAASFTDRARYGRFAAMQYRFHSDIAALYGDAQLRGLLPGLEARQRLQLIAADLADLGIAAQAAPDGPVFAAGTIPVPEALGWLYVAEGSNMGAALLRKDAAKLGLSDTFGARHLAPAPEGPAAHWRAFTAALDAAELAPEDEPRVEDGARAAFARVQVLIDAGIA
ncbi:biliverdin-producing heme oxygenase [Novosphingobium resinovorum]|uniref:biliverdin-producing heme oxygenase n=1 Tax=Novosphingobium resinovorum TaxID=158500 RepID=UPI002ED0BC65|nr:biliverdin-producing heme oxygenase [Novosphingobium resinovorum]